MITNLFYLVFVILSLPALVTCQACNNVAQYGRCSTNLVCGCLQFPSASNNGICGLMYTRCSELVECSGSNNLCFEPDHVCVQHPQCNTNNRPLCYPLSMATPQACPPLPVPISTTTGGSTATAGSSLTSTTGTPPPSTATGGSSPTSTTATPPPSTAGTTSSSK